MEGFILKNSTGDSSSTIWIAPAAKWMGLNAMQTSFSNHVIVHEILHAFHISKVLPNYEIYTAAATSSYSMSYLSTYGDRADAATFYKQVMLTPYKFNYPQEYSWTNLPSFIHKGIK